MEGTDTFWNPAGGSGAFYVGGLWASVLWDTHAAPTSQYGYQNIADGYQTLPDGQPNGGNTLATQLVIKAMELMPDDPTLLDARDAILKADMSINNGRDWDTLWNVLRGRGMGANASIAIDTSSGIPDADSLSVNQDFTTPPAAPTVTSQNPVSTTFPGVDHVQLTFSQPIEALAYWSATSSAPAITSAITQFTGPGGVNLLPQITVDQPVDSETLQISFPAQTVPGQYSLVLGPDLEGISGTPMQMRIRSTSPWPRRSAAAGGISG